MCYHLKKNQKNQLISINKTDHLSLKKLIICGLIRTNLFVAFDSSFKSVHLLLKQKMF
jgi:hypothetical protein